jgi:hypothetical protein
MKPDRKEPWETIFVGLQQQNEQNRAKTEGLPVHHCSNGTTTEIVGFAHLKIKTSRKQIFRLASLTSLYK